MEISVSILSIDYANIKTNLDKFSNDIKYLHLDVMDGRFVPNISFGPALIKSLRKNSHLIFDTHLMICNPEKYVEDFVKAGSDMITFHYEAVTNPKEIIELIHSYHVKAGISINPNTSVEVLEDILPYVDLVLIMSVHPGHGGQAFLSSAIDKVKYLKSKKEEKHYSYLISIDGGINDETLPLVFPYIDLAVSGSYIVQALDPQENLKKLMHISS
ncbi:MAG: ribulose-phosphate 3-epimerase [Anaeroplasmataceae bacterium]|nr:ribulose-phosphate 3-epimerase [Anaeroplasmataceae bacterium]